MGAFRLLLAAILCVTGCTYDRPDPKCAEIDAGRHGEDADACVQPDGGEDAKDAGGSDGDCGTSCGPRDPQDDGGTSSCGRDGACLEPCDNGATNPPDCDTCPPDELLHDGVCRAACQNGALDPPDCETCGEGQELQQGTCEHICENDAVDPPACELCGPGRMFQEGLCRAFCENGATDPPDCVTCETGEIFFEDSCRVPCENGAINPPACDACKNPSHDPGMGCAACLPLFEGYPDCSCVSPLHDPAEQCEACLFPFAGYPDCTQCVDDGRDPEHKCFTEDEKVEHLIEIRLLADHAIYECETTRGNVYFRYDSGAESLERDRIRFAPVYDENAPKEGCTSPGNTAVSGRQACVFFESVGNQWSLSLGSALELSTLPATLTQRLAVSYDCDNDELQEGVTPEICKAEYTCTLYTFNATWPEGDEDGDGVKNADDCAPEDPNAWRYVAGFKDVDDDGVPVDEMELLCIGEELPRGYVAEMGSSEDNCPRYYNPSQTDSNGNGIGDPCDMDGIASAPQEERIEHMLRLRREADHTVYECDTSHGSVYFRYAYGMENLSADYLYFYPVYSDSSPNDSCMNPDLTSVSGRQPCVYFDLPERWSLGVGNPFEFQEIPSRLFGPIATRYDCENGDRSSSVTYEECAGDHVCEVFLPDPSWLSGDDDGDGVDNAEDCAPQDETRWQYLVVYPEGSGGTPAEEDIMFVCAGDAPPPE